MLERMEPGRGEAASGHYLRHGVPMLDKASARTINKNASAARPHTGEPDGFFLKRVNLRER